jgi:sulfonate transport system substrate-binding protein
MKTFVKKQKRGLTLILALTVALVMVLSGCSSTKSTVTSATSGTKKLFTLKMVTQTSYDDTIIADKLGFFKDEGIQVKYIGTLGQGVTQEQAIEQGLIDVVTQGHPSDVAQARLAGVKIKIVAPGYVDDSTNPHITYLVKSDSPIKSLSDLVGKKVGIQFSGVCTDGYIKYYLKSKGLNPNSVQFVTMTQPGQEEQALEQGLIDATASHTPYSGIALATGKVREIGSSWDIFHSPGAGLAVRAMSDQFIAAHPDIVQDYVNAMYRARVFINKNPSYAKQVAANYLGLKASDMSSNNYTLDKNIDPAYITQWFTIGEQMGLWKAGAVEPQDVYTNKFVPAAVPASDANIGK